MNIGTYGVNSKNEVLSFQLNCAPIYKITNLLFSSKYNVACRNISSVQTTQMGPIGSRCGSKFGHSPRLDQLLDAARNHFRVDFHCNVEPKIRNAYNY